MSGLIHLSQYYKCFSNKEKSKDMLNMGPYSPIIYTHVCMLEYVHTHRHIHTHTYSAYNLRKAVPLQMTWWSKYKPVGQKLLKSNSFSNTGFLYGLEQGNYPS